MTQHFCKNCGKQHELHYSIFEDGSKHMWYQCDKGRRRYYVPRVDGLDIDVIPTRGELRNQQRAERKALKNAMAPEFPLWDDKIS